MASDAEILAAARAVEVARAESFRFAGLVDKAWSLKQEIEAEAHSALRRAQAAETALRELLSGTPASGKPPTG